MGVTYFDIPILESMILVNNIKNVIELGAQNNYNQPNLPAPYMKQWYEQRNIEYESIDLTGEEGAYKLDLSEDFDRNVFSHFGEYDLVTDLGTSEHVGKDGAFDWEAIYKCWKNKFELCKIRGIIFSENPETGNWPGHGFNYYTVLFYQQLIKISDLRIIRLMTHPAMNNTTDGWNVVCIMEKTGANFSSLDDFRALDLRKK